MLSIVKVYEKNRAKFRSAEDDYTIIDELSRMVLQETDGKVSPALATKTVKGIVESMRSLRMKGEL